MTFSVKFRGIDGSIRTETVQATDREECFAQMKSRGISPIGVITAKAKISNDGRVPLVRQIFNIKSLMLFSLGLGLLAGGIGVTSYFRGKSSKSTASVPIKKKPKKQKAKPIASPKPTPIPVAKPKTPSVPNRDGWVLKPAPGGKMTLQRPGPDQEVIHESPLDKYWKKPIFKTMPENKLAGLLRLRPGARIIANRFLPGEEESWLRAMRRPIQYEETDSAEDRKLREDVQAIKDEIIKQVDAGKSVREVVEAEYDRINEQAAYREKMAQTLYLLKKEGTPEEVEEFLKEANPILKEQGMIPLNGNSAPPKGLKKAYFEHKHQGNN